MDHSTVGRTRPLIPRQSHRINVTNHLSGSNKYVVKWQSIEILMLAPKLPGLGQRESHRCKSRWCPGNESALGSEEMLFAKNPSEYRLLLVQEILALTGSPALG